MKVLSLFDGISCGRVALERAGIHVSEYYASEIEKNAMAISAKNWPEIKQVGSVVDLSADKIGDIDLLIGGSPCQGFSFAGKQLNFDDPRSKLFFEFVRLKNELNPKFWMLENVKMKKEYQDKISEILGLHPVEICSSKFSAQRRKRMYWTNIPISEFSNLEGPKFSSIIDNKDDGEASEAFHTWFESKREYLLDKRRVFIAASESKSPTLTKSYPGNWNGAIVKKENGRYRFLSVSECEKLQNLPVGYCAGVSKSSSYQALGNGWTVDVIAHIFRGLS